MECKTKVKVLLVLEVDDIRNAILENQRQTRNDFKIKDKFVNAVSDLVQGLEYAIDITFESNSIKQEDKEPIK